MSVGIDVCMTYERSFYFNLPEVQKALHANRTGLNYRWTMCSGYATLLSNSNLKYEAFDFIQKTLRLVVDLLWNIYQIH